MVGLLTEGRSCDLCGGESVKSITFAFIGMRDGLTAGFEIEGLGLGGFCPSN